MRAPSRWVRLLSRLVPGDDRDRWIEEWHGELSARSGGSFGHFVGALADAWYLRTEGWTMDGMGRDFRTALRGLIRKPGFTLIAGVTLAVGIGANTAIFTVVDGVLINPLPLPDSERLVSYNFEAPGLGVNVPVIPHSEDMYVFFHERARTVEAFAVFNQDNVNLITEGDPQQIDAMSVTADYFHVLGIQPALGRGFVDGEDRPEAEPVAVLGWGLFQQSFGGDRDVLGRLVEMDGVQRRIVGVMPEGHAVNTEELWTPITIDRDSPEAGSLGLIGAARIADGFTVDDVQIEMEGLLALYAEENSESMPAGIMEQAGLRPDVKPMKELFTQSVEQVLWVLLGTVGFVLLIACANVANLFLVRAEARQREVAVRSAMGASRLDMVRQYLTESVLLAVLAGIAGLVLAAFGVQGLLSLAPAQMPAALEIGIDGSVLAFTLAVSVVTGLLFGLFPAFGHGIRNVSRTLRDGGRAATDGRERHRARSGLVVTQVALALVLLVGSGLMFRSFVALRSVDLGFEPENRLTFTYGLPSAEYPDAESILTFQRRLEEEMAAVPGVQAVGMIDGLPLSGAKAASPYEPADRPFPEDELAPLVELRSITPGYFETMRIDVVQGRGLEWSDQADEVRAVVVSQTLADAYWPGGNAIGQLIRNQGDENTPWEIVGVTEDVRFDGVADEPLPMLYMPLVRGEPDDPGLVRGMDVTLLVAGDPLDAVAAAREALSRVDSRLPMINPRTVETIVDESLAATSFAVLLLGIAAGIALLLGAVGIYGVISYIVSRRTQEIGVRIALGAPAATVLKNVMGQGMTLAAAGVAIGLAGAFLLTRALASLLYGVEATDPMTFASTALFLTAVALLATWVPARRASKVDPIEALRSE